MVGGLINDHTRLVAVTAASNLIGTTPALRTIADLVHRTDAWFYVDGVHYTAHRPVDVNEFGADFFACSPYKFLGPHCAAVAAKPDVLEQLHPDKLSPAPDSIPERFQLGTLPYELMAGTTAAIDFIASIVPTMGTRREQLVASITAIEEHEDQLRLQIEKELTHLPGVTSWSRAARRTPTLLLTFDGHQPRDISTHLAAHGVNAPAGSFYAPQAARALGLGDSGGLRIGLAPYNDEADVGRLLEALADALTRAH